jgi:UDP-2-acetamido-2,6-beta-L-arabino-hexul-4-ose reductase
LRVVGKCDTIVHHAALNRTYNDPETIYKTNIELVRQLINTLEKTGNRPHILFSSSTQEERDNVFGKSKQEGRKLFASWAERSGGAFTGMIVPNVFGPFGKPYYNSVVATFSYQLTHPGAAKD